MYFIPDSDLDDQPDSAPTVLLDGFGNQQRPQSRQRVRVGTGWLALRNAWSTIGQ